MTLLEIILLSCVGLLLLLFIISLWFLYKFVRVILTLEDQVEESLDIINSHYQRLTIIANTPVLIDEPYVRELINLIKDLRNAVLLIANKIVIFAEKKKVK